MDICDKICALNVIDLLQLMKLYQSRVGITDDMLASRKGGGGGGGGGKLPGMFLEFPYINISHSLLMKMKVIYIVSILVYYSEHHLSTVLVHF
jgi:hypothetical protein